MYYAVYLQFVVGEGIYYFMTLVKTVYPQSILFLIKGRRTAVALIGMNQDALDDGKNFFGLFWVQNFQFVVRG